MSISRQIPTIPVPADATPGVRKYLRTFAIHMRTWVADTAKHLGQLQDVPSRYVLPVTNDVLTYDGSHWTPMPGGAGPPGPPGPVGPVGPPGPAGADAVTLAWEALVGLRNGVNQDFTIAGGLVKFGTNGNPLAGVYQGGGSIPFTSGAPGAFQWSMTGQTFVLGTPPTGVPTNEPIVEWVVLQ